MVPFRPTIEPFGQLDPKRDRFPRNVVFQLDGLGQCMVVYGVRYQYQANGNAPCPICGDVGIPWAGWFNCEGKCGCVAFIASGEVLMPVPVKESAIAVAL